MRQKQKLLGDQIKATKEKLDTLKQAQAQMDASGVDKNSEAYMALQREIIDTENDLQRAEKALDDFNKELDETGAESEDAKSNLDKLKDTLAKVSDKAKSVSEATAKAAQKTRALSTAAAAALTAIAGLAYKAATNADDLNTLAAQTGFTTEELQKMQYAADRIDVSMETITRAAAKMTKKLSTSEKTFADLGVATRDAEGNFRSTTDIFYDTISALSQIENETERDAIAMAIFGMSANELAGIIDDGGQALKEFGDEAEEAGLILDQETLDALNSVNDQIDELKAKGVATLAQAGAKALEALTPVIEKVAGAVEKVLLFIGQLSPQQITMIMGVLAVIAVLSPLLSLISKVSAAISFLASPIGIAIVVIAGLVAAGVLLYKNWDKIKKKAKELADKISETWENIKQWTSDTWDSVKSSILDKFNSAKAKLLTAVSKVKTSLSNAWTSIKARASSAWSSIKSAITKPFDDAKAKIDSIISTIKGWFPISIGDFFSGIKLPHFEIEWGSKTIFGKAISWPNGISVSWFSKAMKDAVIMDGATIFGAMGGNLLGGGEKGREVVVSYDKLAEMMGGGGTTINVTVNASPGMNERTLADMVAKRIQQTANRRSAVWA